MICPSLAISSATKQQALVPGLFLTQALLILRVLRTPAPVGAPIPSHGVRTCGSLPAASGTPRALQTQADCCVSKELGSGDVPELVLAPIATCQKTAFLTQPAGQGALELGQL